MPSLTIRTRVALWYGAVIVAVLLTVALAVSLVHERIGLARLDEELIGSTRAINGIVENELGEGLALPEAAREALKELELPQIGVAILDETGGVLATYASGVDPVATTQFALESPTRPPHTLATGDVRIGASQWRRGGGAYRIVAWVPLAPFERERSTLQNTMRLSIPVAALTAMLGGWLIGRWALQPLSSMAAHAALIDHRRLDSRLPVTNARDELGRLGTAFNALLGRLASVLQAQRQFMADASHELRTPVSIARTAAQVTLSSSRAEAEYRDSLTVINAQMRRLTHVVDDMFMLALADLDARPLERSELYLNEIVADCVRSGRVLALPRGVQVDLAGGDVDISARGDEGLLRQLVMNLLDNGIRHAPDGGHVRVALRRDGDIAELSVEDSGTGIPAAEQDRVFERFVRLGRPVSGGGGLGLAIARWVAEQHGGRLRVDGAGPSSSRFVLTLPV